MYQRNQSECRAYGMLVNSILVNWLDTTTTKRLGSAEPIWEDICRQSYLCQQREEVHDYLKTICPVLHIARGGYDQETCYPETKTLTIGQFELGLCHGHQVIP